MRAPKAYIFDVFGTLVDWRTSIAREAKRAFYARNLAVDPQMFADAWRGEYQPAMQRIREGERDYVPLDDLHRENLDIVLDKFGVAGAFDDKARTEFARAWEKLDPWPDVVEGLHILKRHAIIAPCSNGSIALMTHLAKYADLPWDCILGADIAKDYKPQEAVYTACCKALRLPPERVMMVAAHNNDLEAAQEAGLLTCFIARPMEHGKRQVEDLAPTADWDRVVGTIGEIARIS